MAKQKKYYVVWQGNKPGVYDNWEECQLQIKGFADARYKSYPTQAEAEAAFQENFAKHIYKNAASKQPTTNSQQPTTSTT